MDDVSEFNKTYLNKLLNKFSKENKLVFLIDDFNINSLNYKDHQPNDECLDCLASSSSKPYILQPTKINKHWKTLPDNIFSNIIFHEVISGKVAATISNICQLLFPLMYFKHIMPKSKYVLRRFVKSYSNKLCL